MTERVWYWARRKGERPRKQHARVLSSDGKHARVLLPGGHAVPVQTIAVNRLHSIPTADVPASE